MGILRFICSARLDRAHELKTRAVYSQQTGRTGYVALVTNSRCLIQLLLVATVSAC